MWILFVISFVPEFGEPKFTQYSEYKTEWACNNAAAELEKTFVSGEKVLCFSNEKILDPYGLY